jgi:uncharacterized protein YjbI with pentapeptide repeats
MTKIVARRAAVRPRVHVTGSTVAHLLEDVVRETLGTHFEGVIEIIGGPGMGKTTALKHLAEVLTDEELANVVFLDEPHDDELEEWTPGRILICTQRGSHQTGAIRSVKLTGWSEDDAIEYLLSKHHDQCGSVMARINGSEENQIEYHLLVGCPETVSIVLDRMARDETLMSVKQCIRDELSELVTDADVRRLCGQYGLCSLMQGDVRLHQAGNQLHNHSSWNLLNKQTNQLPRKLLRHQYIQTLLAAEEMIREIADGETCLFRTPRRHPRLIFEAARLIEPESPAEQRLLQILSFKLDRPLHPLAGSLLHLTGRGWRPSRELIPNLRGAVLNEVQWPEENLSEFDLSEAILCDANLRYAQLDRVSCYQSNLVDAVLSHANLWRLDADEADLRRAKLKHVHAGLSSWRRAILNSADLEGAHLDESLFIGADLSHANFTDAELRAAVFLSATISGTIFAGADLSSAKLQGLDLTLCDLSGACFELANLKSCRLEGVNLPEANFQNANLTNTYWTDSILPGANFQHAILRGAGLAGIEWENADLRGADLRESTFHMGSSRSGLVDSFLASEGTRTGFYTDDYEEQYFKSPEEIRKANLRGADLRGANITGVDFYLVDLRNARFDDSQRRQLETTGAILFDRD